MDPGVSEGLTAWMDDATPPQGAVVTTCVRLIVDGEPVAGEAVTVTVNYKTTTSTYNGVTDANGRADVSYDTGRPTVGYTVKVDVEAAGLEAQTQFTPQ
jgi:hypothetical protein